MANDRTILVVDHDAEFRVALADFLQDAGFTVWQASSAADALEQVRRPGALPHLLLVELGLCGTGGAALIEALRRSPARHVPVVALTGYEPHPWHQSLDFPAVAKWQVDRLLAVLAAIKGASEQPVGQRCRRQARRLPLVH